MFNFKIPERFLIFGRTIDVRLDPTLAHYDGHRGQWRRDGLEIRLQPSTKGVPKTRKNVEETFCHELVHAVTERVGVNLSEQEVDLVGCALYQVIQTAESNLLGPEE